MKALLDANVIYPTVMREMLLGAARAGLYQPLWSDRILAEWAHAAAKLGPAGQAIAEGEIALCRAGFPEASSPSDPDLESQLWLPDPADTHVLAAAIKGGADLIITMNAKDFPQRVLAEHGLARQDADAFLMTFWSSQPESMRQIAERVQAEAERLSGTAQPLRPLLKKARLPRLGKALSQQRGG